MLLDGYAGKVIDAFGHFVVGGSLIVGLVVFLILVVIQFVVITKGAERVAEVGARFTLDAMPGKQMAIDADLNAGLIDEDEARRRRPRCRRGRLLRRDGRCVEVRQGRRHRRHHHHPHQPPRRLRDRRWCRTACPIGDAITTYSLLTVGDGLVSQIPALLISVATGLIVTRPSATPTWARTSCGSSPRNQRRCRSPGFAALALCLIPGLPKIPFVVVGGAHAARLAPGSRRRERPSRTRPRSRRSRRAPDTPGAARREMRVDPLELELAPDLIDLVDPASGGDLLDRVRALRRKIASELGIVMPPVRTRDNLDLPREHVRDPDQRRRGRHAARHRRGTVLAIGDDLGALPGQPTLEPVFGLRGKWIPAELRCQAELTGATVVDRASVITTHLAEVVAQHAGRLLGREDVRVLTDVVKRSHPVVVEELTPALLSLGEVQRVLQGLLDEGVPIRDLVRIFEALSLRGAGHQGPRHARRGRPRRAGPGHRRAAPRRGRGPRDDLRADARAADARGGPPG